MVITETYNSIAMRTLFDSICRQIEQEESSKILMAHFGGISQDFINSLSESVEELLISCNEKRLLIKRVFSIFIEGLQNIKLHGEKLEDGICRGILVFTQYENHFSICLGNVIKNKNIDAMKRRLDELNEKDHSETKDLYMRILSNGILSNRGGAGLGFITMKLKSGSSINYQFQPISDSESSFLIHIEVQRSHVDQQN